MKRRACAQRIRFGFVLIHQRVSGDELGQRVHVFSVSFPQLLQVNDAFLLSAVTELEICRLTDKGEVEWRARLGEGEILNSQNSSVLYFYFLYQIPDSVLGMKSGVWSHLFGLIILDGLSEDINSTVNVLLMCVHGDQGRNLHHIHKYFFITSYKLLPPPSFFKRSNESQFFIKQTVPFLVCA